MALNAGFAKSGSSNDPEDEEYRGPLPFSDTASKTMRRIPYNNHHMEMLSTRLSSVTQYRFKFGKAYDLNLYPADGTIFDYMAGVQQIPFSLAVELWGNEEHTGLSCFDEFNPPSHNLQTEVEAIHPLYVELFSYLDFWKQQQTQNADSLYVNEVPSVMISGILVVAVSILCAILVVLYCWNICRPIMCIVSCKRLFSKLRLKNFIR
ncbi:uncharacterized protein LOC112570244 isoform X7 [Pomacea canaliculata]|uniref:uncharacterized protein LOC112570244 isoform X7 n=1 Tax=Pomacea canaliculata TaxID=400727 RepID=UPI000D72D22E|nr:uncharacterized protein LOC112570244 isoform X7 [Pomacea canaliculata]